MMILKRKQEVLQVKKDTSWLRHNTFSHRGLHNEEYPENTTKSFINSIRHGYGIELDVQLTKDNEVIVFHDYNLERMTGYKKNVNELTYEQISRLSLLNTNEKIPLLKDVLKIINNKVSVLIELKISINYTKLCERVFEIVKEYNGQYSIQSFDPRVITWYEENANYIIRGQIVSYQIYSMKNIFKNLFSKNILLKIGNNADYICHSLKGINNIIIVILRKKMPIVSWTVKNKKEMKKAYKYSDSIIFEEFIPRN